MPLSDKKIAKVKKQAGTWAFPKTPSQALKLKELMSKPVYDTEELYNIFGDDELFDKIDNLKSKQDIRSLIKARLEDFLPDMKNSKTKAILEEIIGKKIPYAYSEQDRTERNINRAINRFFDKNIDPETGDFYIDELVNKTYK